MIETRLEDVGIGDGATPCSQSELIETLGVMVPLNDNTDRENWLNSWVKCSCGCRRKVKNCKRYTETESWEMPWIKYEVCVCPRCGNSMEENP